MDLGQTGLLPAIQEALSDLTEEIQSTIIADAKSTWSKYKSSLGPNQSVTIGGTRTRDYGLFDTDWNNPLIVLGHGTLTAKISGWFKADGTYEITFTYKIDDPFVGVVSGGIGWGYGWFGLPEAKTVEELMDWIEKYYGDIDMPYSTPYNMIAEWEVTISGSFE